MKDLPTAVPSAASEVAAQSGVVRQVGEMLSALRASPVGKTLVWLAAGIVLVVIAGTAALRMPDVWTVEG